MNPLKVFLIVIALAILASVAGCKKASAPASQTGSPPANTTAAEQFQHSGGATTPLAETKYFKGSIGSALGLQMKLRREGERLTGTYFYQKIGTRIELKGTIDKDGNLTLQEFDTGGKQTGVFQGIWKVEEDGMISIAGNWSKPGSEKKTAFSLHQEPIEFTGELEIVAKPIKESNKKLGYEIDVEYPQVTGATDGRFDKFNQEARNLVARKIAEFKKDMTERAKDEPPAATEDSGPGSDLGIGYSIALAKDDLVSIEFDIGGYYRGAAHPNSYTQVLNYDVNSARVLKLADLFKPGPRYVQTISAYSISDLKKQSKTRDSGLTEETIETGAAPKIENFKSWTINRKGLAITFDSYQVGPYVAGPQNVLIPYATLKDLIKPDGPVGQFVK